MEIPTLVKVWGRSRAINRLDRRFHEEGGKDSSFPQQATGNAPAFAVHKWGLGSGFIVSSRLAHESIGDLDGNPL